MTTFDEARNQLRALMPLAHEGILAECWPIIDARIAELEAEVETSDEVLTKLSDLLRRTCDALKGPHPEPLTHHSWHNLPEVAAELVATNARLVDENAALLRNSQAAVMATAVANQEVRDA